MTKIIGITGGIASGKSTVTDFLRQQGYAVIDADAVVHDLQAQGGRLYKELLAHFGSAILLDDGELDRAELGRRIFSDEAERAWSQKVQGSLIREELAARRDQLAEREPLFFMDIPLLYEQGYEGWFDAVWLVDVEPAVQLERLMMRDGLSPAAAQARMAAQLSSQEKKEKADAVIDNNGRREETLAQAAALLKKESL